MYLHLLENVTSVHEILIWGQTILLSYFSKITQVTE